MSKFSVPHSSLGEVEKIIRGYVLVGEKTGPEEVARRIGINRTTVSRNNKFLAEIGIVSQGQKRDITELGEKLGRALDHKIEDEIKSAWREVVQASEFLSSLVSLVRVQGRIRHEDFLGRILYTAKQSDDKRAVDPACWAFPLGS